MFDEKKSFITFRSITSDKKYNSLKKERIMIHANLPPFHSIGIGV